MSTWQVGPYRLTETDTGWTLRYVESQEDLTAWEELLTRFPAFGNSNPGDETCLPIETSDGTEVLIISAWTM